jgi:hypothetical protein
MQKVEGSSPFSRSSESPVFPGFSRFTASRIDPPGGRARVRIRDGYEIATCKGLARLGERVPENALQDGCPNPAKQERSTTPVTSLVP